MGLPRRGALLSLGGALLIPLSARADGARPSQPIRIVVPYPPGALTDFFAGLDAQPWMSLAAPAGTPPAIVSRLNAELNKSLADADFAGRLRQIGVAPSSLTVSGFNDFIASEAGRWAEMVKLSGARAD